MQQRQDEIKDKLVHPISVALTRAMEQVHLDYDAIMQKRKDKSGNFDPMKLPDDRACIKA